MGDNSATFFPAGTPVIIVGFRDKAWGCLEAFAHGRAFQPNGIECGKLVEPFRAGSSILLDHFGVTVGIKTLPGDTVNALESFSKERMVSIARQSPDENGMSRYLVIEDRRNFVRDLGVSRGFMCGFEPKMRMADEVRRICGDLLPPSD